MSTKIPILSVYDENGNKIDVPAIGVRGNTDTTLSVEGAPADAKVVGDALSDIDDAIVYMLSEITYDLDVIYTSGSWTVISGSFEELKTKLMNAEVVNCRIRKSFSLTSDEWFVVRTFYNMDDESIDIKALTSNGVVQLWLSSDNSFHQGSTTNY